MLRFYMFITFLGTAFSFKVSNLANAPFPRVSGPSKYQKLRANSLENLPNLAPFTIIGSKVEDIQNLLFIIGALSYFIYEKRPMGSANVELIAIKKSEIPTANLGVFAIKTIPSGTVIGTYPGYLMNIETALSKKVDFKAKELSKRYMWSVTEDLVIDPTDKYGKLDLQVSYLFGLIKIDTILARINEPPKGGDCNVYTRIVNNRVEMIAERDIYINEELYMDYGVQYYRDDYLQNESSEENTAWKTTKALEDKQREQEGIDMLTIQPISLSDANTEEISKLNQETSVPEGFLSKLKKSDEENFKRKGILSPEDGIGMYKSMGSGMFASAEDQELIQSLMGTADLTKSSTETSSTNSDKNKTVKEKEMEFASFLDSLLENNTPSPPGAAASVPAASKKNNLESIKGRLDEDELMTSILTNNKGSSSPRTPPPPPATSSSTTGRSPLLSEQDATELQNKLDSMSDEEVKKLLIKLQSKVSERVAQEMSKNAMGQIPENIDRKLPRSPPQNKEVREKYGKELEAIEKELEEIYKNPMASWKTIMENPEKYLNDMESD